MKDGTMTRSQAGRLGWEKTRAAHEERRRGFKNRYDESPKICLECGEPVPYEKRANKYCGHSCSAKANNRGVRRHGNAPGKCKQCGKRLEKSAKTYCSSKCQQQFKYETAIRKWISGETNGQKGTGVSNYIRRWLKERCRGACEICAGTVWLGRPMPLEVDHIDGNYQNNSPDNLRMICGNCGMQLPTYKGRNTGNGRWERRKRYADGKSY